jgi:hypothetical protein
MYRDGDSGVVVRSGLREGAHRHPWAEHLGLICGNPERYAAVAAFAIDWFERAA